MRGLADRTDVYTVGYAVKEQAANLLDRKRCKGGQ